MTDPGNKTGKENFASRWSRRKQGVKLEQATIDSAADEADAIVVKSEEPRTASDDIERIRAEKRETAKRVVGI